MTERCPNTFQCLACGGSFHRDPGWTYERMVAEYEENLAHTGAKVDDDAQVVCDDCYAVLLKFADVCVVGGDIWCPCEEWSGRTPVEIMKPYCERGEQAELIAELEGYEKLKRVHPLTGLFEGFASAD